MLRVTDPQLENLMFLRDVTIPWMRENPERVDFAVFESECGTFGCLLGWYAMQRYGRTVDGVDEPKGGDNDWDVLEFGATGHVWRGLFSGDRHQTLDDRARYLDELIAQRLVALEAR